MHPYSYDEPEPDSKRPKNDVFMNYSDDIGKQFISHLKGALGRRGFTISDHTMLPVGQDMRLNMLKGIEESEIYVVVFSNNYASSVRSLDELVDIMDCLGKFHQRKALPVFYKVEPSDVRSQEGSFTEAFQAHEAYDDIDSETVQKWKQALKDAGQLSGLTLQNGDEGKFVLKVVKQLEKMQRPKELHVADHPVVIRSRVKELISTLRLDSEDVLVVAVFGSSGIGKTTIVKDTYNKISSNFDVSCFIEDIHYRCGGPNWKIELQNHLISSLTQNDKFSTMHNHNDGVEQIKKLLRCRKTLLVLDHVGNFDQLKSLGINPASFYKGSRIIVITRDKQSLGFIPYTSYQTRDLSRGESLSLFNRLMLSRDNNLINMKSFIGELAALSGGIPLVLEVWSRYFIGHERKQWPSLVQKLKRIPHRDVQKQLQMSYNSLSVIAKDLFLDIACFLHGIGKELVVSVLHDEELGFFPDIEIQGLVDKFLVKYTDEHKPHIWLSHVIKDMGQEVVRQENPKEPGQRTRLIGYKDVVRVFREYSGTDSIRSIRLEDTRNGRKVIEEEATIQFEAFKKMSNLRFIMLRHSKLKWSSSSNDDMSTCFFFKHLKYLEWDHFPFKSLDNIDMPNVVVIKLRFSKLEKLWERANKSLRKLKILEIGYSKSLTKTGDFIGLENLEELDLRECSNLKELDSSISCLKKLVSLNLGGCKLELRKCTNDIPEISNEVGCLKSLRYLLSSKNKFNGHSNSLCQLHQLTRIVISGCKMVRSIPNLPPNTESLRANRCSNLENIPSNISELQNLKELQLRDCFKLGSESFTQVTGVRNLQYLNMRNCDVSQVSSGIGNLVSLYYLNLSKNTFSSLPESFSNLSKLVKLFINSCSQLQLLPPLSSQLKYIEARNCGSLDVMPFDSMQNAYSLRSKVFKESLISNEGFEIHLSGEELPEWCTYRNNSGNVISFVAPIQIHTKICGLLLCATRDKVKDLCEWGYPTIYNKTKGTSHQSRTLHYNEASKMVMFCPLNDTTLGVKAGDTVELQFDEGTVNSVGLRLVYEDDLVDSGLVLKDVRKPTVSC